MELSGLTRRGFLVAAAGAGAAARPTSAGDDAWPPVTDPRATDGDDRIEPNWDERLKVAVGTEGRAADHVGRDDKAIRAALGHVAGLRGGTVRLLSGTYTFRHAVVLPSRVRLVGSGGRHGHRQDQATRPGRFAALAAYGDYGPGYIGTVVAYSQGGYETSPSSSLVAPGVERVLTDAIRHLLRD